MLYIFFVDLATGGDGLAVVSDSARAQPSSPAPPPLRDTCNTVLGLSLVLEQVCSSLREGHVSVWWDRHLMTTRQRLCPLGDERVLLAGLVNIPEGVKVHYEATPSSHEGGCFHKLGCADFDMRTVYKLADPKRLSAHDAELQQQVSSECLLEGERGRGEGGEGRGGEGEACGCEGDGVRG